MQEARVWSLGWEDPLEKGMATHSSFLAWEFHGQRSLGGLQSMGSQRVRLDWVTDTFIFTFIYEKKELKELKERVVSSAAPAVAKSLQSCPTLRLHGQQPTRFPHPWDSPGKNTGVGCQFLLQCTKVRSESEVAQSCLTFTTPWTAAYQAPPIHGIFQARVLEWAAIAFSDILSYKVVILSKDKY